jgi:deoxyribose-phosphate aldolase
MTESLPQPSGAPKGSPATHANVEKLVGLYIAVRAKIEETKERHKKELEEAVDLQKELTGKITDFLAQHGVDSVKTSMGTAYSSVKYSASLEDPDLFMKYVIETKDWDLLDRKANVTACRAYVDEHSKLPPGVKLSSIETLGVRSPTGKAK